MLGMRTRLPCHISDRWSRGANAFGQISPSASSTRVLGTRLLLVVRSSNSFVGFVFLLDKSFVRHLYLCT